MGIKETYNESLKKFVQDHLNGDPAQLLFAHHGKTDFDIKAAVQQIKSRQKAKLKLPSWTNNPDILFPSTISLEQASSEQTAIFKSSLVKGKNMIDLTGGFGVDTYYLGKNFEHITYCERQEELAAIVHHNFNMLSPNKFNVFTGDSMEFLSNQPTDYDLIYLDPARRGGQNQKLYQLADCEPDLVFHWNELKSKSKEVLVKASPMLDLKQVIEELKDIQKIYVLSVKNEVKEILLHWQKSSPIPIVPMQIQCVELHAKDAPNFIFTIEEEIKSISTFGDLKKFLIEPNVSILKAGAFKTFGVRYRLDKLDPNSHFYTTATLPDSLPARIFEIQEEIYQPKKQISKLFPNGKVNVITRNYVLSAEDLKKKYRLKDGGDDFIIGTKVAGENRLFHAKKVK